jgi:hypothetical protein
MTENWKMHQIVISRSYEPKLPSVLWEQAPSLFKLLFLGRRIIHIEYYTELIKLL